MGHVGGATRSCSTHCLYIAAQHPIPPCPDVGQTIWVTTLSSIGLEEPPVMIIVSLVVQDFAVRDCGGLQGHMNDSYGTRLKLGITAVGRWHYIS